MPSTENPMENSDFPLLRALGVPLVDSHAHVFPEPAVPEQIDRSFRNLRPALPRIRARIRGIFNGVHELQLNLRHLPHALQPALEWLGGIAAGISTGILGGPTSLLEEMHTYGVSKSLVIASHPFASNDFLLDLADQHSELAVAIQVRPEVPRVPAKVKRWVGRGAKAIKIHLAMEGGEPDARHYQLLCTQALEHRIPIIIHTGCIHLPGIYRKPELGHADVFEAWFRKWPEVQFVLAHMNFHEPEKAIRLAERYSNLHLETSWQPLEIIEEALRRIGPDRILFGSDTPLLGSNLKVGLARLEEGLKIGTLTADQVSRIVSTNALNLFKLGLPKSYVSGT